MADKPSTVGEYIAALPEHAAVKIAAVRQLVHETAPNLSETLKWTSQALAAATTPFTLRVRSSPSTVPI